jgi:hypothetical protein
MRYRDLANLRFITPSSGEKKTFKVFIFKTVKPYALSIWGMNPLNVRLILSQYGKVGCVKCCGVGIIDLLFVQY